MKTERVWAIIAAAGGGRRLGRGQPKAFVAVGGRPLLFYSLAAFKRCRGIGGVVAAVPQTHVNAARRLIDRCGWSRSTLVCAGDRTRALSVRRAMAHVPPADVVVVHDAARPLVSVSLIERVIASARRWGAAAAVKPVSATLKRCDKKASWIMGTVERTGLYEAETPQAFRYDLWEAVRRYHTDGVTDEAGAFERAGVGVRAVTHTAFNIKVTWPEDLKVLRRLVTKGRRVSG